MYTRVPLATSESAQDDTPEMELMVHSGAGEAEGDGDTLAATPSTVAASANLTAQRATINTCAQNPQQHVTNGHNNTMSTLPARVGHAVTRYGRRHRPAAFRAVSRRLPYTPSLTVLSGWDIGRDSRWRRRSGRQRDWRRLAPRQPPQSMRLATCEAVVPSDWTDADSQKMLPAQRFPDGARSHDLISTAQPTLQPLRRYRDLTSPLHSPAPMRQPQRRL